MIRDMPLTFQPHALQDQIENLGNLLNIFPRVRYSPPQSGTDDRGSPDELLRANKDPFGRRRRTRLQRKMFPREGDDGQ